MRRDVAEIHVVFLLAAPLAAACASTAPAPPAAETRAGPASPPDCAALRDETVLACVRGFRAKVEHPVEGSLRFEYALQHACPYAGAVAWSGCHRDAYARFAGRSAQGPCGDRADYVESAIYASCFRQVDLPLEQWNALARECIEWAQAGASELAANCLSRRTAER